MPLVTRRPCKKCGQWIEIHDQGDGRKPLVLQPVRSVYQARDDLFSQGIKRVDTLIPERNAGKLYVSHFETCPHADVFSSNRRGRRRR